jgi:carbamate kinase
VRLVVALGGNALLERGEPPAAEIQAAHVVEAVRGLTPLLERHDVVLTHGNGPQVGLLALESAADPALSHPYPFDVLDAQTQGMIGYLLLQAVENEVPGRRVASLITQTLVSAEDPGFARPTKFVGPVYDEDQARANAARFGWTVAPDGPSWRRVVASPEPVGIVELDTVAALVGTGAVVVCAGGGGIPVCRAPDGSLRGAEAVVDKDLTASLLARDLDADALLLLTDVEAVELDHGTPSARAIRRADPAMLRSHPFAPGSMGPKVEAVCRFAETTGKAAMIGRLTDATALLEGRRGTFVRAGIETVIEGPSAPAHPVGAERRVT